MSSSCQDLRRKQSKERANSRLVALNCLPYFMSPSSKIILVTTIVLVLFIKQGALALNSVLDLNGTFPYLINKTNGQIIQPKDYMDFENLYSPNLAYRTNQTAQGRNYHLMKAFDFANYYQSDYWHYSNKEELRLSAQPVADPNKCAQQLDWLERKLNKSSNVLFGRGEQHINLMSLLDSFGTPEAGTYLGHGYWLGSHYQCMRTSIDIDKFEQEECRAEEKTNSCNTSNQSTSSEYINSAQNNSRLVVKNTNQFNTRYCIGKVRDIDWPSEKEDDYVPKISYKIGLCLPEVCETLSFGRHKAQIERLMRFNMAEHFKSRFYLYDIYCLPDNRSPIRAFKLSSRIFLSIVAAWFVALCVSTVVYSCYKQNKRDLKHILIAEQVQRDQEELGKELDGKLNSEIKNGTCTMSIPCAETNNSDTELKHFVNGYNALEEAEVDDSNHKNIVANGAQLLMMKTQASLACANYDIPVTPVDSQAPTEQLEASPSNSSFKSTSSSLSIWLNLSEHPMTIRILQALSIKENVREFQQPPLLLRSPGSAKKLRINLNALDAIKCLCCILVIFGHIIFIHMQHLSNILHTIELSHELSPRLMIAFFNFVDTFFIISGMLTAYFIFKRFNKKSFANPMVWFSISLLRLLRLSPVYMIVFWFTKTMSIYVSEGPIWDYGTDKNSIKGLCMNDHWWKSILYLGNLGTMQPICILPAWSIIVDAQYSLVIPPILYLIYKHKKLGYVSLMIAVVISTANMSHQLATQTAVKTSDMAKVRLHVYPLISRFAAEFYNAAWNRIGPVAIGILGGHILYQYDVGKIRRWPWFMRGPSFKFILILHLLIFVLPAISRFTDDPESTNETDLTIFVLSNATIKPIWSLINTIFLLRLITDLRHNSVTARLMSHNIWHCLGKLCFASYLIHYEVIMILLKSREEGLVDPNWSNAAREFSLAFLLSTAISYFVYILFEAPMNKLINLAVAKPEYLKRINNEEPVPVTIRESLITKASSNNHQQQNSAINVEV